MQIYPRALLTTADASPWLIPAVVVALPRASAKHRRPLPALARGCNDPDRAFRALDKERGLPTPRARLGSPNPSGSPLLGGSEKGGCPPSPPSAASRLEASSSISRVAHAAAEDSGSDRSSLPPIEPVSGWVKLVGGWCLSSPSCLKHEKFKLLFLDVKKELR
jgi:hypothetical protein